jgi:hypothetical protein
MFSDRKSVEDSNGIFYSIRINDIIAHIEQNKDPRAFENVKVYAGLKIVVIYNLKLILGDPWYRPAKCFIKNFSVRTPA